jgi:hypothetical protein
MTKEEVLQKVNDYCNEKSYTSATLTDGFKDKFAEHFTKRYPDAQADDETALGDMKFALNTAFSGASLIITEKNTAFTAKENEYKTKIQELQDKIANQKPKEKEIPKEVQEKLKAYDDFMNLENKKNKYKEIMALAKKEIRQDLHSSFEKFAMDYDAKLDKDVKEQATMLTNRFQEIFKDSIGDIKPLAPRQQRERDEEFLKSLKKVKVQ